MSRWMRLLLMGVVLGLLAGYVWRARGDFARILSQVDVKLFWLLLAPMIAVPLGSLWVNAQIGRDLVEEFDVRLGGFEAFALATINALGNYLPLPQAGAMARGVYLKKVHGLAYTTYAATVVVTYFSSLALTGLFGIGGLTALAVGGRAAPWQLWIAFAGLSASLLMFTPIGSRLPLPRRLALFKEGLATLRGHHILGRIVVLQVALILITATGLFLSARVLPGGAGVTWPVALMLGLISMVAAVVNVLGVEQVAAMACASLLGIDANLGLLASALFRLTAIAVVFLIGPLFAHWLSRRPPVKEKVALSPEPAVGPAPSPQQGMDRATT